MFKSAFLFFSFLFISTVFANAQVHKRFVDQNFKFVKDKDSTKASGYVLFEKFEQDSSIYWAAERYDKLNNITFKGIYLDEELTILQGKVTYYQTVTEQKINEEHAIVINKIIRVKATGFYDNGLRLGTWTDYYLTGKKFSSINYDNDQRNGFYKQYDPDGRISSSGNYLNGNMEGDWYTYNSDSTINIHSIFKHGHPVDIKKFGKNEQVYHAYPKYNFDSNISRYLKKLGILQVSRGAIITFTITKDGTLIDPKIISGIDLSFDKALINALNNCPKWMPALYQAKPVEEVKTLVFEWAKSSAL